MKSTSAPQSQHFVFTRNILTGGGGSEGETTALAAGGGGSEGETTALAAAAAGEASSSHKSSSSEKSTGWLSGMHWTLRLFVISAFINIGIAAVILVVILVVLVFLFEQVGGETVISIAVNQRFRAVIETPALHVVRAPFPNNFQRRIE